MRAHPALDAGSLAAAATAAAAATWAIVLHGGDAVDRRVEAVGAAGVPGIKLLARILGRPDGRRARAVRRQRLAALDCAVDLGGAGLIRPAGAGAVAVGLARRTRGHVTLRRIRLLTFVAVAAQEKRTSHFECFPP